VEGILEPSQNWMTEQLVRALGMELGRKGSWEEGFQVEEGFLTREVGVDSLDIHYRDASGLSAYNLVTPRAMVQILAFMRDSPRGELFRNALAEPGEEDSTLENRLTNLEGRVFGKTGTISHVNSLSGYLTTESGREIIFSILTNGSGLPSSQVREGIDAVIQIVARR
jgi:D-alanyl-D-alanine carboxypeptidase/D-alanyl-D-alanine-endopeptidase (penicillin-binding protein 4)